MPVGSAARQRRVNQRRVIAALRKNEIRGSFVLNNRTQDDRASIRALKQLSVGSRKDTRFSVSSVLSVVKVFCLLFFLVPWCLGGVPPGSEYHGVVTFGGLPLPGATITATQGSKQFITSSDLQGLFSFPALEAGKCTLQIQMTGFATLKQEVTIGPNSLPGKWELKLLSIDQLKSQAKVTTMAAQNQPSPAAPPTPPPSGAQEASAGPVPPAAKKGAKTTKSREAAASGPAPSATNTAASTPTADQDTDERAANGFLINGSAVNGASSPFAQSFAFGNNRGGKGLYNGGIGVILDNSALDARPYSLTGQNTPKPSYNRITGIATLGGPLRISRLLHGAHDPNIFAAYEWTRSVNDSTQSALVPSAAERAGDFSQVLNTLGQPVQIFNPSTGQPFSGNLIPQIDPQARRC